MSVDDDKARTVACELDRAHLTHPGPAVTAFARRIHEAVVRHSVKVRTPWGDLPQDHRAMYVAVAGDLLATTPGDRDRGRELAEQIDKLTHALHDRVDGDLAVIGLAEIEQLDAIAETLRLAAPAETEAGDDERPGHWITEECARARARFEQLPRGARPVVTRPVGAQRAAASPPAPEGEAGSVDGALAWVERAAWDTPTAEQRTDEGRIPHELIDVVSRVLRRKYRAIAARLVAERWPAPAPAEGER